MSCVSATANGVGLVAVGNSDGSIFVYDLTKHLMLWETWSFRIDEDRISRGLNLLGQQSKADEQRNQQRQPQPLPAQEANKTQGEEKQENHDTEEKTVEKQAVKEEGKDERDNTKEEKEVDRQTEKQEEKNERDSIEEGKEIENQKVVETEPLHREDKTSKAHEQKQEGDQEKKTVKEGEPPTSQHTHPVSSCKLHSLGIVQLTKEKDSGDSNTSSPKRNKKDDKSSNVDPSLLIGVSYCRSSGAQDAVIIVCDIHTVPTCKSVATSTKKNKAKSTALSSAGIGIEPMSDPLMDIDDVIPSALPITVDIDTPSWELVPPLPPEPPLVSSAIPPPPPLPPLKNGSSASKTEKGSQLQIFVVSEYIDDLPVDAHPVVSVIQPCGYNRVAVALEYGPSYGGCIILFNLEQCTGKTILGKSIIYEFAAPDQQVLDMCVMENLETKRNGNSHFLAAVTRCGSFTVFSMEMNVIVSMNANSDPFVSCFPCVNVGLFGLVTKSGVIKTVKVVSGKPVPEVNVLAADVANSNTAEDTTIPTNSHKS